MATRTSKSSAGRASPGRASNGRRLKSLETALGHTFADAALLEVALTHASMRAGDDTAPDNERLEFLGDRVLGLAIAELLTTTFSGAAEGELARRFNRLVRRETCADVAMALDLGRYLVLSEGEADSGGRAKLTILADACEAVLGAIFLDGGFEPARAVVRRLWFPRIDHEARDLPDPKSALQEWAQGLGMAIPIYALTGRNGPDHAPHFTAEVRVPGRKPAVGRGTSKRLAEQEAATAFLLRERVWQDNGESNHSEI